MPCYGRRMDNQFWNERPARSETCYRWQVGPLSLWVLTRDEEWRLTVQRDQQLQATPIVDGEESDRPTDAEWQRWATGGTEEVVQLLPVAPDRGLVIRPAAPLVVPARRRVTFYVNMPVWLRVLVGAEHLQLTEVATEVLSKTWFGDPQGGELCYSLRSNMRHRLSDMEPYVHLAVCPVIIHNTADKPLDFQRFCLQAQYLSLFAGQQTLKTNAVEVTASGEDQLTEVKFLDTSLPDEPLGPLVSGPRMQSDQSLLRRSFGKLISFGL